MCAVYIRARWCMCDVYILPATGDCVCVRVYLLSEHHFTVNFTYTHTYIHTKQPAYGRHRKTYFPLKTYNAGVRQCVVCCVVLR